MKNFNKKLLAILLVVVSVFAFAGCGDSYALKGEAKVVIADGLVSVNGEVCTMRGKKLYDGYVVSFEGEDYKVCISE